MRFARAGDAGVDVTTVAAAPTAVTVRSFSARHSSTGIMLAWRTASEVDTLGFNVYRHHRGKLVRSTAC